MTPHRLAALIVLTGAASIFALRPEARLYENRDVSRYAQLAYEMRHAGSLMPLLDGKPYHEAMPIAGQAPYAVAALQGRVTPLTSRVFPAISAFLMVALTLALARARGSARVALLAAGMVALTHLTYTYARESRIDAPLGFACAAAVAAFFHGSRTEGGRRFLWYALAGVATALAICIKGPAAAIIPAALFFPLVLERRWRALLEGGAIAIGLALALTAAWLLPYRSYLGPEEWGRFWDQMVNRETIDKVENGLGKEQPPWFYLVEMWPHIAPWILPAMIGLARTLRRPRAASPLELLAASWVIVPIALFSIATGKHVRYLVPMVPAFSILAAFEIERWLDAPSSIAGRALRIAVPVVAWAVLVAGVLAPFGLALVAPRFEVEVDPGAIAYAFATGGAAALGAAIALIAHRRGQIDRSLIGIFIAHAAVLSFVYAAVFPLETFQERSSAHYRLAKTIAPLVPAGEPLAALLPPPVSGEEYLEASLLALHLEVLQGAPRWVDIADPKALPTSGILFARERVGDRPVLHEVGWLRFRGVPEERWYLLGPPK